MIDKQFWIERVTEEFTPSNNPACEDMITVRVALKKLTAKELAAIERVLCMLRAERSSRQIS